MSEQLSFYKLFKEKGYSVEIPIIQRDFAQGRKSASEIRGNFLLALKNYLDQAIPFRDLDFVYGDVDKNNSLILLDGQQRLTTLFLLHWYFACKEQKMDEFNKVLYNDGSSKFSYKTRQSATDFFNALFKISIDLNNLLDADEEANNELSKTIKNSPYYFLSWNNDPTIQSIMNMLDDIHGIFYDNTSEYYAALIDLDEPIITFQFLELSDYGLTDDLYIKMNSRGKPLSKFENFKAKFESHLKQFDSQHKYNLTFGGQVKEVGISEYFSFKIDTTWADLFWGFKDDSDNTYDTQLMNFINVIAINHTALNSYELRSYLYTNTSLNFSLYESLDIGFVKSMISAFDVLSIDKRFTKVLGDFHYYDELASFEKIISGSFYNSGYRLNILFYAYYSFLIQWNGNVNGISEWMRVICNLAINTPQLNDEGDYINAIRSVSKMLPNSNAILDYLKSDQDISKFNLYQVKEEKIKAHLLNINSDWQNVILESEKQQYFEGQLTFAIAFSGIENYYDIHKNCNWNAEDNNKYYSQFCNYLEKIFELFDDAGLIDEAAENHLFHRAVLAKGDYTLYAQGNYSFLMNSNRDISWKRLLLGDDDRKEKREYIKQVLDDPKFQSGNIKSLETMLSSSDSSIELWRKQFIEIPELFDYLGKKKYIRHIHDDKIYLVKSVKITGEHAELFSYCLYMTLRNEYFAPFNPPIYYFNYNYPDSSGIFLWNWELNNNNYKIRILYTGNSQYKIWFNEKENKTIAKKIKNILEKNSFLEIENRWEIELPETSVLNSLKLLCTSLNTIL